MEEQMKTSWQNMIDRLQSWLDIAITNLPNVILSILVFSLSYWLSQKLQHWINHPLKKIIKQSSVRSLVSNLVAIVIIAFGLFLSLGILNLDTVLKSLLAGAGVAGLAVGLALQGTLSNTFSGVALAINDVVNIGDFIQTNGYAGTVEEITLRHTRLKESDNNIVIIPNKTVLENPFKNYGLTRRVRTTITCGVGYDEDLQKVQQLAIHTIRKAFPQKHKERIEFYFTDFGDSSINFMMRFWVSAQSNAPLLEAKSDAIMLIKVAFEKQDINIPYPTRTLYTIVQENVLN